MSLSPGTADDPAHNAADDPTGNAADATAGDSPMPVWQTTLVTLAGLVIMLTVAGAVAPIIPLIWWVATTAVWVGLLVSAPGWVVRGGARRRGLPRTILWLPFVGPYLLGLIVIGILEIF